jgi:photosystem II stability/assembly factor-like uncharacterized protein
METPKSATTALSPACGQAGRPPVYLIGLNDQPLTAVQFVSADDGWVAGGKGILATSDGGRHWRLQYSGGAALQQVDFVDHADGWAVGEDQVLRTVDVGQHWEALAEPCPPLRSVDFVSTEDGFGVAGGEYLRVDSGVPLPISGGQLVATVDGGRRWAPVSAGPANVTSVCFSGPEVGWAATPEKVWGPWTAASTGRSRSPSPRTCSQSWGAFCGRLMTPPKSSAPPMRVPGAVPRL